ncbi:hypothetical protein CROQUDRAFT_180554 [Cronartium quercuum f. sp. fusiforme G11]|uniref:Uncharacterized protein n=1 Tax=Cronartium quercuum f. sp. fusiforme G11 TaxID=708437 RepID=A0A9P6NWE9_9BASI|nr:hypothetical protein CROQUDRAFT_180554 [Cronartium quercuum f. sp. fusiforme G11]
MITLELKIGYFKKHFEFVICISLTQNTPSAYVKIIFCKSPTFFFFFFFFFFFGDSCF